MVQLSKKLGLDIIRTEIIPSNLTHCKMCDKIVERENGDICLKCDKLLADAWDEASEVLDENY